MTTIIATKNKIVGDFQRTSDSGLKFKGGSKIFEVPYLAKEFGSKKCYVGGSGEVATVGAIFEQWFKCKKPRAREVGRCNFVAITGDSIYSSDNGRYWDKIEGDYFAIGSGASIALGAVKASGDPVQAMEVVEETDAYTGYGYNVFEIE